MIKQVQYTNLTFLTIKDSEKIVFSDTESFDIRSANRGLDGQ